MKVALFTQVHNAQEDLKEWIEYHQKFNFDTIIIYEDIYSSSHKDITKNYDNVILQPIKGDIEKKLYENSDEKGNWYKIYVYRQNEVIWYLSSGEMKTLYNVDYCLFLDTDEFLAGNINDIHDLANYCEDNKITSVRILWNIFSSGNYITKPQIDKPIYEIYTEESVANEIYNCGHKYNKKYDNNLACKSFCKTDGSAVFYFCPHTAIDSKCYDKDKSFVYTLGNETKFNLYINHYMYKSYEDYVYRRIPNVGYRSRMEWWFGNLYSEEKFKKQREIDNHYYQIRKNKALNLYKKSNKDEDDKLQLVFNAFPYYLAIIIEVCKDINEEVIGNKGIITYYLDKEKINDILSYKYLIFYYSSDDEIYVKFMKLFNIYKHETQHMSYLDIIDGYNKVYIFTDEFKSKVNEIIQFLQDENIITL